MKWTLLIKVTAIVLQLWLVVQVLTDAKNFYKFYDRNESTDNSNDRCDNLLDRAVCLVRFTFLCIVCGAWLISVITT